MHEVTNNLIVSLLGQTFLVFPTGLVSSTSWACIRVNHLSLTSQTYFMLHSIKIIERYRNEDSLRNLFYNSTSIKLFIQETWIFSPMKIFWPRKLPRLKKTKTKSKSNTKNNKIIKINYPLRENIFNELILLY